MQMLNVLAYQDLGLPVQDPLLDRVRQCSSRPEAAADFFLQAFYPIPEMRMTHWASCHEYLQDTFDKAETLGIERETSWPSQVHTVPDCTRLHTAFCHCRQDLRPMHSKTAQLVCHASAVFCNHQVSRGQGPDMRESLACSAWLAN